VYVEEVVGEVETLGSVGGGGSIFEDGGWYHPPSFTYKEY
jgi:hypothetical protein